MLCVSTSAGRVSWPERSVSIDTVRSTASAVRPWPVRRTVTSSVMTSMATSTAAGGPDRVISLPRTCTPAVRSRSRIRRNSSRGPSRLTISIDTGTVIRRSSSRPLLPTGSPSTARGVRSPRMSVVLAVRAARSGLLISDLLIRVLTWCCVPMRHIDHPILVSPTHPAQGETEAVVKTHYYTATTIDGYIADEDNSLAWLFQLSDGPESDTRYASFIARVGALVMGSTTYEWLLREEIRDDPSRWPYTQPTWVFTTRELPRLPGADLRFVSGAVEPVYAEIAGLLPDDQDLWLVGGGELVGMF